MKINMRPSVFITITYLLASVLVMIPYYNKAYRIVADWLHFAVLVFSLFSVVLVLIPLHISKRDIRETGLLIVIGLVVLFAGTRVQSWRYQITDYLIKAHYCGANGRETDDLVLGGIKEIRLDHRTGSTGAFVNDSHCLLVVCDEEFHYCDDASVEIGP